ncbi:CsxC family protein [Clostridium cibarium]|uniref:DUF7852 domain-containing protein n=1 Tax=Clostridium cibarium TaxID=2762247 RepID=A0ABR8PNN5_9CLOT|nr:hypothetical protein [Clostridium cibarium]MBD7909781.1 hypothetical protein [Clostridium cibarium]
MGRMYYSRQKYNQRKRKQYEEYLKRQIIYYLYKKKCREEYLKRLNEYYSYKKKYNEEHHKKNSNKTDTSKSEFFNSLKAGSIEYNNINDNNVKNNNYDSLEVYSKESNLEYKKDVSFQYDNLENNNRISIGDSCKEEFLEENDKEFSGKDNNNAVKEGPSKETNISTGSVYVKLPVILAEANITIPVEATITLHQAVMEIKRIKKNLFLTQSRLIPFSSSIAAPNSGILFIAGFIRKNIEYEAQTCTTAETANTCENIRHCIVEVPFNFTTRITFLRPPIFIKNITTSELEFFTDKPQVCDVCAEPVFGRDPCEQSFLFTEVFNEKPYVELVSATFTEVDIHKNPILSQETSMERMFTQITEKIMVNLTLKVLQNQQVKVTVIE